MITADFIEVTYHLFKSHTLKRVKCDKIELNLLPRKGDYVVIDSSQFLIEQVIFYPFGDVEGKKGAKIYISRQ